MRPFINHVQPYTACEICETFGRAYEVCSKTHKVLTILCPSCTDILNACTDEARKLYRRSVREKPSMNDAGDEFLLQLREAMRRH